MTYFFPRQGRRILRSLIPGFVAAPLILTGGCGASDGAVATEPQSVTTLPSTMVVTPQALVMAIGDSTQLSVAGLAIDGVTPVTRFDTVAYTYATLSDSTKLRVAPTGMLTALAVTTSPITVNVKVTIHGVSLTSQVYVTVTATVIPGLMLSIQPPVLPAPRVAVGGSLTISVQLKNSAGTSVPNPALWLTTTAPINLVTVTRSATGGRFAPRNRSGSAWFYGTVNVYGTTLMDSVQYSFEDALNQNISITSLSPQSNILGYSIDAAGATQYLVVGGLANFTYSSSLNPADTTKFTVTFDNTAGLTSTSTANFMNGTITKLGQTNAVAGMNSYIPVQFNTPGTYHWTITGSGPVATFRNGLNTGTIIVEP